MAENTIYAKTPAGTEEMQRHTHSLSIGARRLLILIDGNRGMKELRAMLGASIDAAAAVAQLLQHNLILAAGVEAEKPKSGGLFGRLVGRAEPEAAAPVDPELRDRMKKASLQLHEFLGPEADGIVMRLEKCADAETLDAALQRAAEVVRDVRGRAAADKFRNALGLPAAG